MTRRSRTNREKIKFFFKEYGATISGGSAIAGLLYAAGFWTANIYNSINENRATQQFNKEISEQKKAYDKQVRNLEIENDNLRHQYQLLELKYKQLEHESNKKD